MKYSRESKQLGNKSTKGVGGGGGVYLLKSDPTNKTDLNEHSLPVEIMKSTDKETVIKLSKFISLCFEKRSKCLEARKAESQ
jgi:hypothetical protein